MEERHLSGYRAHAIEDPGEPVGKGGHLPAVPSAPRWHSICSLRPHTCLFASQHSELGASNSILALKCDAFNPACTAPQIVQCNDRDECSAEAAAAGERRGARHSTLSQHNVAAVAAAAAREVTAATAAVPSPVASRAGSATSQRSCISTHSHGGGHISFAATVPERASQREVRRDPHTRIRCIRLVTRRALAGVCDTPAHCSAVVC